MIIFMQDAVLNTVDHAKERKAIKRRSYRARKKNMWAAAWLRDKELKERWKNRVQQVELEHKWDIK